MIARTVAASVIACAMVLGTLAPAAAAPGGAVTLYVTDFQDGGGVYALSADGGALRKVMRSDGSHRPIGIEVVGATAYVTERHSDYFSTGRLVSVPLSGGAPTTVAELSTPGLVTAIGDTLYVTDSGQADGSPARIVAVPIGGGVSRTVTQENLQSPLGITSIGSTLYFVDRDSSGSGRVLSVAAGGGAPQVLATLAQPLGITTVGNRLFVTDVDPIAGASRVVSLATTGGEPQLIHQGTTPLAGIIAAGNTLYTAGHVETTVETRGNVSSLPLAGGPITTINTALKYPTDVAAVIESPPCSGSVCLDLGDVFGGS